MWLHRTPESSSGSQRSGTSTPEHPGGPAGIFPGFEFDPFVFAGNDVYTYGIGIDLAGEIDLVPGMVVEVGDVPWEMSMTVTEFSVDAVDSDLDTVAGFNPRPPVPEGPGLVGTFTSGPTAFGFGFPDVEPWETALTPIVEGEHGGPYDITGTEVGLSFGSPVRTSRTTPTP